MSFFDPPGKSVIYCPHCKSKAKLDWHPVVKRFFPPKRTSEVDDWQSDLSAKDFISAYSGWELAVGVCQSCGNPTVWIHEELVWPDRPAVEPSEYLPEEARKAFDEAQLVISRSPQCACAMLRLALERLVVSIGAKGNSLRAKLLSLNLSPDVEKLCEACRIVGNDAVHEGVFFDDPDASYEQAVRLSKFVNWVTERTVAAQAQAKEILGE